MHAKDDPRVVRFRDGFWFSRAILRCEHDALEALRLKLVPNALHDVLRGQQHECGKLVAGADEVFVRRRAGNGAAHVRMRLADSAATLALWPHAFAIELTVTASGSTLGLAFAVTNTGTASFMFTAALHTYLRIADVRSTFVHGLQGAHYRDKVLQMDDVVETAPVLTIDRQIDRVYRSVPAMLEVREPGRTTIVHAAGFTDTVIWNPGAQKGATLHDLDPGGYAHMLCVEAAVASQDVTLQPQETWRGSQALTSRGIP